MGRKEPQPLPSTSIPGKVQDSRNKPLTNGRNPITDVARPTPPPAPPQVPKR